MADWKKFWERMNEAIPDSVILQDSNVFGDYLDGQYVVQLANQICLECGLSWRIDWSTVRVVYTTNDPVIFIKEMTGDLVVTDGEREERRPACGLGTASDKDGVKPKQLDTACKGALTDLIKNGWMRFGRRTGGQLYFGKNPHVAEALGWEISKRQRRTHPHDTLPPSDLASYTIHSGGWGSENKFGGMTLEEIYSDPDDGYGAMAWAATLDTPRGATAKMAQYFNLREQEALELQGGGGVPDGVSLDEYDGSFTASELIDAVVGAKPGEMVTIAGRRIQAKTTLSPEWTSYVKGRIVRATGSDEVFGHSNHVVNHLKSHFNVAKVMDLTGEKAAALINYIQSFGKDADPRWYGPITQEDMEAGEAAIQAMDTRGMSTEPLLSPGRVPAPNVVEPAIAHSGEAIAKPMEVLFGPESVEDLLKKAAPNLPAEWKDKPEKWWAALCKQFSIGIMNAKQLETVRFLLEAVASGNIDLENTTGPTQKIFVDGMQKVADDA